MEYSNDCCEENSNFEFHNKNRCKCFWRNSCIIIGLLFSLIVLFIFGFFYFINNKPASNGSGSIIPYTSANLGEVLLATNPDESGDPMQIGMLADGTAVIISTFMDKNFDIIDIGKLSVPWDASFAMPRDGTITSVSATYTTDDDLDFLTTNCQVSVKLYSAEANSQIYHALKGTNFDIGQRLNGVVPKNTVLVGSLDNLDVSVKKNSKLLLVFYLTSHNPSPMDPQITNQYIRGFSNAGVNIK